MKKILETLKQKFMNKFFWNLQIETVVPDIDIASKLYIDNDQVYSEGSVIVRGTYLITCNCEDLRKRLELLLGRKFLVNKVAVSDMDFLSVCRQGNVEDFNEKLKICFDLDFLSDKRWTRRYYVKLG